MPSRSADASISLEPGTVFGAYEIIAPIGTGGMGTVFRASTPGSGATSR